MTPEQNIYLKKESKSKYLKNNIQLKQERLGSLKFSIMLTLNSGLLQDKKCFLNILLTSKEWNKTFKNKICRILLKSDPDKYRFVVWKLLIFNESTLSKYEDIKIESLQCSSKDSKYQSERIRVDVMRSFHNYSEDYQKSLVEILRVYASYNKEIEYCQGMNCIAGFIFDICNDEAITFNMFSNLLSRYKLTEIFKQDVPLLRSHFYQMDRLIAIYLPNLHSHLFHKKIMTAYFASPWFLTIFTYVIQYSETKEIPKVLLKLFDEFLTKGMVAIYKWSLFMLEHFEEKLLKLEYEGLIQFLNDICRTDFFFDSKTVIEYQNKCKRYNITPELLKYIEEEYNELIDISQKLENIYICKKPFSHYLSSKNGFFSINLTN